MQIILILFRAELLLVQSLLMKTCSVAPGILAELSRVSRFPSLADPYPVPQYKIANVNYTPILRLSISNRREDGRGSGELRRIPSLKQRSFYFLPFLVPYFSWDFVFVSFNCRIISCFKYILEKKNSGAI